MYYVTAFMDPLESGPRKYRKAKVLVQFVAQDNEQLQWMADYPMLGVIRVGSGRTPLLALQNGFIGPQLWSLAGFSSYNDRVVPFEVTNYARP